MHASRPQPAADFPDTRYVAIDFTGRPHPSLPNVSYVSFGASEGSFLVGAAAALKSRTGRIGFIGGMDIPNIKNVKIGLQTLRLLNVPMTKLHLVLNRANSKVKLDVSEVERTLQIKAESLIPSDVVVPQSVNKGVPVVLDAPKSGVAKAIEQLANTFAVDDASHRRR